MCSIGDGEWRRRSPGAGSVSGENEDRGGEEEQASLKWKWVSGVNRNRQNSSGGKHSCVWRSHMRVHVNDVLRLCVCVLCLYKEHVASCVFTLENIGETKGWEEKGRPVNRKSHDGDGEWWEEGLLPDTEVRAAGVVASNRGHSACVGAYVTRPGLGDVKRTICI